VEISWSVMLGELQKSTPEWCLSCVAEGVFRHRPFWNALETALRRPYTMGKMTLRLFFTGTSQAQVYPFEANANFEIR
jgi:hypothetical protein